MIGQSSATTNTAVVAYGAEGSAWSTNALYLVHNTLLSDEPTGAWFLRVWSAHLPVDTEVVAVNNLTVGRGLFALGARGRFDANFPARAGELGDSAALDFRVGPDSLLHGAGVVPPVINGRSLAPEAEFEVPIGTTRLAPPNSWTPGALQSAGARR